MVDINGEDLDDDVLLHAMAARMHSQRTKPRGGLMYPGAGAPSILTVLDSDGNSFTAPLAVLDSDGNSFTLPTAVLDSDGNSFTAL